MLRRSLRMFVGLSIAFLAVAVSFYSAPPPHEPTVPSSLPKEINSSAHLKELVRNEFQLPPDTFVKDLPDSVKEESININDPAFQHIKNQLKIDTSLPKCTEVFEVLQAGRSGSSTGTQGTTIEIGSDLVPNLNLPLLAQNNATPRPPLLEPGKVNANAPTPNITNQKLLKLHLIIDQVGKSGITHTDIEIHYSETFTNDLTQFKTGNIWDRYPQAPKTIDVCLGKDGAYLIRPIFYSGAGQTTKNERNEPVLIYLDTQKPDVIIENVCLLPKEQALAVEARIFDRNFDKTHIKFEYTEDGITWKTLEPKQPLSQGTSNEKLTQSYHLNTKIALPQEINSHLFFRIVARDLAGNETIEYHPKRILMDTVVPKGRLLFKTAETTWWGICGKVPENRSTSTWWE